MAVFGGVHFSFYFHRPRTNYTGSCQNATKVTEGEDIDVWMAGFKSGKIVLSQRPGALSTPSLLGLLGSLQSMLTKQTNNKVADKP